MKKLQILLSISIVLAILLSYIFVDFNALYLKFKPQASFMLQDESCNLKNSTCKVTIEDGTILELEILPKHIPLMEPLEFRLKSSKSDLENVSLTIYATNMMMGIYELDFKKIGEGEYITRATLPTCPVGNMKWNADVEIKKLPKAIGARFKFETD